MVRLLRPALRHQLDALHGSLVHGHQGPAQRRGVLHPLHHLWRHEGTVRGGHQNRSLTIEAQDGRGLMEGAL